MGLKTLCLALVLVASVARANYNDPNFEGNRTTIVHLFEWKWKDIAMECERFLGPMGYAGVQVSPPNENAVILAPFRPWWERYQPVSYILNTRSGNEQEFSDMCRRCNAVGVRIYIDAVINHMTHQNSAGPGTAGSSYNSQTKSYPSVPFTAEDFHGPAECPTASGNIENHQDPIQSRNCELDGLRDLNQGRANVRTAIINYFNKLVSLGVAGFRVDCTKQIWPEDQQYIFDNVNDLPTSFGFAPNTRPFVMQEVIILGEEPMRGDDYFGTGRITEFKYGLQLGEIVRGNRPLRELRTLGQGMYPDNYALAFVDNHDNQRGHGSGGQGILTFREPRLYKIGTAFMLAHPYGVTRMMSSYFWDGQDENSWVGPPNTNGQTDDVIIKADGTCDGGWICEHRWRQMFHMVHFRNLVAGTPVTEWWDNGNNQIAFCRGNKGFIAINNDNQPLSASLQTCLPAGEYCDIITSDLANGKCTGRTVVVGADGRGQVYIANGDEEAVIAIHLESKI